MIFLHSLLLSFIAVTSFAASPQTIESFIKDYYNASPLFNDVSMSDPYYTASVNLYQRGIVEGYKGSLTLGLDNPLNRAESSKLVSFAQELTLLTSPAQQFSDVSSDLWASVYIDNLALKDIVSGYPDGTFKPGAEVTMPELVSMLAPLIYTSMPVRPETWQQDYYHYANYKNVLPDTMSIDDIYRPITRGEAFEILYRVLNAYDAEFQEYYEHISLSIPSKKISIDYVPTTEFSESSVWLYDLTKHGTAGYYDIESDRWVVFAHSSAYKQDPNPLGSIFRPLLYYYGVGDTFNLTVNGEEKEYQVTHRELIKEYEVDALGSHDAQAVLFTCNTDISERWVYYGKEVYTAKNL